MWICNRCQTRNREGDIRCIQCSAPRSGRRFGAGTVVETPSVSGAAPQEARSPQVQAAPLSSEGKGGPRPVPAQRTSAPQVQEKSTTRPHAKWPRSTAARLLVSVGLILATLLPALLIYLAVSHYAALSPQLNLLFFPAQAAAITALGTETISPVLSLGIYALVTTLAVLLCLLPGLLAMGLGRLLIRLTHTQGRLY